MRSTELVVPEDFPKPVKRTRGKSKGPNAEKKLMGIEAAAIAYVQMENGEYRYGPGSKRVFDEDGQQVPNNRELMRRAGYRPGCWDKAEEYLFSQDQFWELVELHRIRRTDPNFRSESERSLWSTIGGESLRNLYERVFYYPHSLSPEQYIKIIKLILDAGIAFNKMGETGAVSKSSSLINSIPEDKRDLVMNEYKKTLLKEIEKVESLEKAERGAKLEESAIGSEGSV